MLTLEEIKKKKAEYGYSNEMLAKLSKVPLGTVQKVMGNVTKTPRYGTLKALSAVFEDKKAYLPESEPSYLNESEQVYNIRPKKLVIAENTHEYDRQGYTVADYLALPDEQRAELIDGVLYDMDVPALPHQLIGGEIYSQIFNFVKSKKEKCMPLMSPVDVQLDMDESTIVQPDVLVVRDLSKLNAKKVFGAPDFVVEVLSPSTRNKDILIKANKYQNAGVREYWMVDPDERTVLVMNFEEGTRLNMYNFDGKVPVGIFGGECEIDFKEISEYISVIEG